MLPAWVRVLSQPPPGPDGGACRESATTAHCGASDGNSRGPSLPGGSHEANLAHRYTPLVTEECEGQVTVTDPCHPLYGRTLKLLGLARLPGYVRHCQVEILPGRIAYIPVASTNLSTEPRPEPTVLTGAALEELVAAFQAWCGRRSNHAASPKSARLDTPDPERSRRGRRGDCPDPHGDRGT